MSRKNRETPESLAWSVLRNCLPRISLPIDLYAVANKLNIDVVFREGLGDSVEGLSIGRLVDSTRVIVLKEENSERWPECCRRNFTMAHELGHIILSEFFDGTDVQSVHEESFVNRFAGGLLIPIVLLAEEWNDVPCGQYSTMDCSRQTCPVYGCKKVGILARRFGVSLEAMRIKIQHCRRELHEGIEIQ